MASGDHIHQGYILGIDLGTTTVKTVLLEPQTNKVFKRASRETQASIASELGAQASEQDLGKILTALQFCVSTLPKDSLLKVKAVGISGQMHGVTLWSDKGRGWSRNNYGRFDADSCSVLYTWQDGRCSPEFISSLPPPSSHLRLATGHGCATLFWIKKNKPEMIDMYECAGTVQDYVVCMLCGLDRPIMSVHNAASWGYYDTTSSEWDTVRLKEADFPVHLLPGVKPPSSLAGRMQEEWYGIPQGTPVGVALGDLQCSILSGLRDDQSAVLNISTSAQLAFQMPSEFVPVSSDETSPVEFFPFFNGRYLAVAAALSGGNVMAAFVRMLKQWTHDFGLGVPEADIWKKLVEQSEDCAETDLVICPTLYGERHSPSQRASVSNITQLNISLGSVFASLCKGVVSNLHGMMSQEFLMAAGMRRIIASGTAVVKNPLIAKEIERQFRLPLELGEESTVDAAVGAARAMMVTL